MEVLFVQCNGSVNLSVGEGGQGRLSISYYTGREQASDMSLGYGEGVEEEKDRKRINRKRIESRHIWIAEEMYTVSSIAFLWSQKRTIFAYTEHTHIMFSIILNLKEVRENIRESNI